MNKIFAIVLLILASVGTANAADGTSRGRWLCDSCYLAPPLHAMSGNDLQEAITFIKVTVNAASSSVMWRANDTIQICDGSSCILLVYQVSGNFLPLGGTTPDTGQGYKNGQVNHKVSSNSDTKTPIGGWYVWHSYYDFTTGYQRLVTGSVTITQDSDAQTAGLGANFSSGFNLGGGSSSYAYGGDILIGGYDIYASAFGGGGNNCPNGTCNTYMQR